MTTARRLGAVAAIGTLTAGIALLTGLSSARADELQQLEANQQLLQQEINQIAALKTPATPGAPSMAGSFPRSILIPGTDTSLAVGGYVKFDAFYWMSGGPANGNVQASDGVNDYLQGVPLDLHGTGIFAPATFNQHSRSTGVLQFTARESRFHVETRTPTAWGPADTYLEFDFYGCNGFSCSALDHTTNSLVPRLRLAYGTLGPWLAGQDWVPVDDLEAQPEMVDFGGEMGHFGYTRAAQLRYTWQGPYGLFGIAALVQPTTDVISPLGAFQTDSSTTAGAGAPASFEGINPATSKAPDGNFIFGIEQPWGHLRLNAIAQQLELQDGAFVSKDYVGYGGGFSGNVRPNWFGWPKDGFGFEAWAGSGLGRYADNTPGFQGLATNFGATPGTQMNLCGYGSVAGGAAAVTPACAAFIRAGTITSYGGQVNYAHYWTPNLRSTAILGYQGEDVPATLIGAVQAGLVVNRAVWDAGINLIWSPVAFVNIGLEYDYGQRVTVSNIRGDENVLEGEFQVSF
jgi:hypothetical protein